MSKILPAIVILSTLLLIIGSAGAETTEPAEAATSTEPGVAVKVEKAVERGTNAAVQGVKHGATAAAEGAKRGATAAENGVKRGAHAAASGIERGANATARVAHHVAEKVGVSSTAAEK